MDWHAGLFLREIGRGEIGRAVERRYRILYQGAGLLGTSPQVVAGWFDPDEEHVPLDMFAGGRGASARKGLIQQFKIGHLIDLRQQPVGKTTTAGAGNLPAQQLDRAIQDSMVVRFHKAILAMISKPNHALVFDGRPEQRMGLQQHLSLILTRFG